LGVQVRDRGEGGPVRGGGVRLARGGSERSVRCVQTIGEVAQELMRRGLEGARLLGQDPAGAGSGPRVLEGERLAKLVAVLGELEESVQILERRGPTRGPPPAQAPPGGPPLFPRPLPPAGTTSPPPPP